jgi:hypothetical protein
MWGPPACSVLQLICAEAPRPDGPRFQNSLSVPGFQQDK